MLPDQPGEGDGRTMSVTESFYIQRTGSKATTSTSDWEKKDVQSVYMLDMESAIDGRLPEGAFSIRDLKETPSVGDVESKMDAHISALPRAETPVKEPPLDGGVIAWLQVLGGFILVVHTR
jgi:hypothetical protein